LRTPPGLPSRVNVGSGWPIFSPRATGLDADYSANIFSITAFEGKNTFIHLSAMLIFRLNLTVGLPFGLSIYRLLGIQLAVTVSQSQSCRRNTCSVDSYESPGTSWTQSEITRRHLLVPSTRNPYHTYQPHKFQVRVHNKN
jgi:hypothetical protein